MTDHTQPKSSEGQPYRMKRSTKVVILVLAVLVGGPLLLVAVDYLTANHQLDKAVEQAHSKGYPVTNEELPPPLTMPDNGATKIRAVYSNMMLSMDERSARIVTDALERQSAEELYRTNPDTVIGAVRQAEPHLARLRAALKSKAFCYRDGPIYVDTLVPHLIEIRRLGNMAWLDGVVRLDQGHTDAVLADLRTCMDLADTLDGDLMVISGLTAIALDRHALDLARRLAQRLDTPPTVLHTVGNLIAEKATGYSYKRYMMGEIVAWHAEVSSFKLPDPLEVDDWSSLRRWLYNRYSPMRTRDIAACVRTCTRLIDQADEIVRLDRKTMTQKLVEPIPRMTWVSNSLKGDVGALFAFASHKAELRTAAIALSLGGHARDGKTPDLSLKGFDSLLVTDPFGGEPLRAKLSGDWLLVYSIDADLQDDGGVPEDPADYYRFNGLPRDIVFRFRLKQSPRTGKGRPRKEPPPQFEGFELKGEF